MATWTVVGNRLFEAALSASAQTLFEVARDPRHLGAEIGFFSVLHTWSHLLCHREEEFSISVIHL
jgi:hypothetical protein